MLRRLACVALLLASACSPSAVDPLDGSMAPADAGTRPDPSGALPCAVDNVLRAHCQSCHGDPPTFGAPMPLVTWDDTHATRAGTSQPVWQTMQQRVDSAGADRMPPIDQPALGDDEKAALDAWFASSAPTGDACTGDAGLVDAATDATPIGPGSLPCAPGQQTTFRVHGDGPGNTFHVAEDSANEFVCFTFASHFPAGTQATAFAPAIGDARVVHHYILYSTATQQTDGAFGPCHMPLDATFVTGWAPGGGNTVLPDDVGLALATEGQSFILQMHYFNVAQYTDANDSTGVAICTTPTPRPQTGVVLTTGTTAITIPAHATGYTATGTCSAPITAPLHIIRAAPHMHLLGTSIETDRLVGGSASAMQPVVSVPVWSFNDQANRVVDATLMPGDVLRTTCRYDNPGNMPVTFGEDTQDEMCFDFLTVWPASSLPTTRLGETQTRCVGR